MEQMLLLHLCMMAHTIELFLWIEHLMLPYKIIPPIQVEIYSWIGDMMLIERR